MKTACKACGKVGSNRLNYEKTKIICELCGADVPTTPALLQILTKKGLVRGQDEPLFVPPPPVIVEKPVGVRGVIPLDGKDDLAQRRIDHFNSIRNKSSATSGVVKKASDGRGNFRGGDVARDKLRPTSIDDRSDPQVRSDRKHGVTPKKRELTPSAINDRMKAKAKEEKLKEKYAELDRSGVKIQKIRPDPNFKEYTIYDGFRAIGISPEEGRQLAKREFGLEDD